MQIKNYKTALLSWVLVSGLCERVSADNIIFTGPNQAIDVTQDRGQIDLVYSKWKNDRVDFYYPHRKISKGLKNLFFYRVSVDNFSLTYRIYVAPCSPQTIEGRVYHSDFFVIKNGGSIPSFLLEAYIELGTRAGEIKNIDFTSFRSNFSFYFVKKGLGVLDFTMLDLAITYRTAQDDPRGNTIFYISKATETNIIPSDEMTGLNAPLLNQTLYLAGFDYLS
ncbi:hypothetical protein, partial [Helicobacter brantae]